MNTFLFLTIILIFLKEIKSPFLSSFIIIEYIILKHMYEKNKSKRILSIHCETVEFLKQLETYSMRDR